MFGLPPAARLKCDSHTMSSLRSFLSRILSLLVIFLIITISCNHHHHQIMETLDFHKTKPGVVDVDFKAWDIQLHGLHNIEGGVIIDQRR